ncbi:hypothetical protein Trad_1535 [Truepera radiovictrix DSM 17093]|uniref:Uncharacterized protein n=1 Tax=Truepera radiovictrix (strain DSM 17093 / CIP 108686 / LMG 22925 / RQ-24) TaxID=649638 RepID=D7CXQ2_TRURR|nr:hypothetical protein Trad_1535 [Truepera radiovictrix DSM 17093]
MPFKRGSIRSGRRAARFRLALKRGSADVGTHTGARVKWGAL